MKLSNLLLLGTTCILCAAPCVRAAGLASIRVTTTRSVIPADGHTETEIIAQVQDDQGRNIADGTRVLFAVTSGQGRLDTTVVATQGGIARVRFVAADTPGSALITVSLETPGQASPAQVTVRFASEADAAETGTNFIHIEGENYLAAAVDLDTIQADGKDGKARAFYRNTTISANSLRVNVRTGHVVAVGKVTLEHGKEKRMYQTLQYNLLNSEGSGERDADGRPHPVLVEDVSLIEKEPTNPKDPRIQPERWQLEDISSSNLLIKSSAIDLEPGKRIEFRRATYYVDQKKLPTLPYQVFDLSGTQNSTNQLIGYNNDGVTVDLPFYYDVRPSGIGTLHIRRGAQVNTSAYSNRPGWSLDLEQGYNVLTNNAAGTFELLDVTRPEWGARLRHSQQLGGGISSNLFLDLPNHQDLFATTQLSRNFRGFTLSATGTGSRRNATDFLSARHIVNGDVRGQLDADTPTRPFLKMRAVQYNLNLSVARQTYYGQNAFAQGAVNTQTTGMRLTTSPLHFLPSTLFSQSLSFGQNWVGGGGSNQFSQRSGAFVRGTSAFTRSFGVIGSGTLTYDYQQSPIAGSYSNSLNGHHRLGFDTSLTSGGRWRFSFNGSRGLDTPVDSMSSSIRFNPNFASGPWGFSIHYYGSRYDTFRSNDFEYALIRHIGDRDFALYYSTTARRIQFDLTGARF